MKISAMVLTYNDAKYPFLEKCLTCLKEMADEIVVYDGFSTDETREIASKYTDKVFIQKGLPKRSVDEIDFAKLSNDGVSFTSNDWVLILDSDEYINPIQFNNTFSNFQPEPTECVAFPRYNLVGDEKHYSLLHYPDFQRRFYNKKYFYWVKKIHQALVSFHKNYNILYTNAFHIYHYGWLKSEEDIKTKYEIFEKIEKDYLNLDTTQYYNDLFNLTLKKRFIREIK